MATATTTPRAWLDDFVGVRRGSVQPDGRPLYAWRCTDAEYEALRALMRVQFTAVTRYGRFDERGAEALFCLYAAEAWRRTHEAGGWKWQTVLDEADIGEGWYRRHYRVLTGAVDIGLDHWCRPLLILNGTREYLLTVACEGGLPLRLLEREGTRLRDFFLALQDEARRLRLADEAALAGLAQRLGDRLPPSLRQPVVFQLAGRLIAAVEDLYRHTAGATDPLARLDAVRPAWRDALPLTLADGPLRALLGCLLVRPAMAPAAVLRWLCTLEAGGGAAYALVRRLDLPPTVTGGTLADWLRTGDDRPDAANLAPRYRLLIARGDGTAPLALATRLSGSGDTARYRLELIATAPALRSEAATACPPDVYLLAGGSRSLPVAGADELSELPWVYSDPVGNGDAEWLGAGSVRVREASALVAVPDGYTYTGDGVTHAGRLGAPARVLLRVAGDLYWSSPDGETGRVRCADPQAGREDWRLHGPTLADACNARPVYLGLPRLQRAGADGGWTPVDGALEWRPVKGTDARWRRDPAGCRGRVRLRWIDADGELRFRAEADVLPAATTLRFAGAGVRLEGLGTTLRATAVPTSGADVLLEATGGALVCRCTAAAGLLPPLQFELDLDWPEAGRLTLALPFPLQGGAFTYLGAVQRDGVVIPAGRLGAATLEVQTGAGGGRFVLEGGLQDPDGDPGLRPLLWFRHEIRLAADARTRLNLGELEEAVGRLFGATNSRSALDATVRLQLCGAGGRTLASADIARFGLKLEPDREHGTARLVAGNDDTVDPAFADRLSIEALPLWAPQREAVPLAGVAGEPGVWSVADALTEPGPWLLLGRDGDWHCVRPLLWTIRAAPGSVPPADVDAADTDAAPEADAFAAAVRSPADDRDARYAQLCAAMAGDPAHVAWPAFDALLALGRELPPAAFDACRRLVEAPATAVTALLRTTDASFDTVWSLADALPFDWALLPVADWYRAAAAAHARYLALAGAPLADTLLGDFCTRMAARGPIAEVIANWLRRELLGKAEAGSCLSLAASTAGARQVQFLITDAEQTLRQRRAEADWPDLPRVLEAVDALRLPALQRYADAKTRRAALCAPFVAASVARVARRGVPLVPALRHELRRLRDFDSDWFDRASALTLCLELADHHPERQEDSA